MVAFDQMRLKLSDFKWVYKVLPAFNQIFDDKMSD